MTHTTFTPEHLVTLPRPGGVVPNPRGDYAVYCESEYNVEKNETQRSLYLLNVETSAVTPITTAALGESHSDAFFLDDRHVAYLWKKADQPDDGITQLYVLDIHHEQPPYALSDFPVAFGDIKYNHKRQLLTFSSMVYPELVTLQETKNKDEQQKETKKDTGMVFDELMIRRWDTFVTDKRNTLFSVSLEFVNGRYQLKDAPRNLLLGTGLQCPLFPSGDASDYAVSEDGNELAFVSKITSRDNAWQTSQHIYTLSLQDSGSSPLALNDDIPAASSNPTYSPSGRLAYLQMKVPQYEADRNQIVIYDRDTKTRVEIAKDWDRSPSQLIFSADESVLYAVAEEFGRVKIFAIDLTNEKITTLTHNHSVSGVSFIEKTHSLLFNVASMNHPLIAHTLDLQTGKLCQHSVSQALKTGLDGFTLAEPEEFTFTGALGDTVHSWVVKPYGMDPAKKYPVAIYSHGGPQGAWNDNWSTRWNYQVIASAGYVVVAINPHGSTGYGQAFCDAIEKNWFTHPFEDMMTGLDVALEKYAYLDGDNAVALGASYGGTMINYMNGNTDRFKALVSHDGIFNTVTAYYTTDELYFPEREFGGPAHDPEARKIYEKFSPSNYVQNWKTPTLVIHGGKDYRLIDGEGFSVFTALQRQGVPSRLLYFADENHWVLKPANSLKWHHEVIGWMDRYTK